ncbi:MAG TPA: molecular chaperone TorD family protein [Acidimicrobiales bacterium]|nr:molecular chaperone TorD family protein [Acidimicrobiales bacterium]
MTTGNWELWRALAAVADNPADARTAAGALGIPVPDPAEHTEVFVLNCPPYASIHLGAEGGIGGEGADRVAGFWRAIGLDPPAEPDHLSSLLALYAHLGEAGASVRHAVTAEALAHARAVLLWEHLWSWVPNWLDSVTDLGTETVGGWAELTCAALQREARSQPRGHLLPAALRDAPPAVEPGCHTEDLLDALISPLRSGFVLTRTSLARIAQQAGAGYRLGERRFALRAMLEQDRRAILTGLGTEAGRWSARQARRPTDDPATKWWARRSAHTAAILAGDSDDGTTPALAQDYRNESIPTTGPFSAVLAVDPRNGAAPRLKTPPSAATSQ